jgi:hypothetical protein
VLCRAERKPPWSAVLSGPKSAARTEPILKPGVTNHRGIWRRHSAFGETQHPKDVAVADARSDVRCDWTPMTAPFLSHSECVEVMPRVAFMEKMDQQTLFEKSRIFFHLATLDRGTAPLFEHLAVRYWMTAVALDEQTDLRLVSRAPTERTAA